MDQLRKQVARARRRLIMEQFVGRLVWCLLGALHRWPRLPSQCRASSPSRICPSNWDMRLAYSAALACGFVSRRIVDVHLQPQPARCRHRNRSPLRPARTHRQQPVASTRRTNERSRPRGRERRPARRQPHRCRRQVPREARPPRVVAARAGGHRVCARDVLSTIARRQAASIRPPRRTSPSKSKSRSNRSARKCEEHAGKAEKDKGLESGQGPVQANRARHARARRKEEARSAPKPP